MKLFQPDIENMYAKIFFDDLVGSDKPPQIIASQADFLPISVADVNAAVTADPLQSLRASKIFKTDLANCHDFSFGLKNYIDQKRRTDFLASLGEAEPGPANPATPLAFGVILSRTHAINIFLLENAGNVQIGFLDYFSKIPLKLFPHDFKFGTDDEKRDFKRFLNNSQTNAKLQVLTIYF